MDFLGGKEKGFVEYQKTPFTKALSILVMTFGIMQQITLNKSGVNNDETQSEIKS